tara:strand:- start:554 stop:1222 length:669 start_codon:yes stop_codon:yes gene_type:complete
MDRQSISKMIKTELKQIKIIDLKYHPYKEVWAIQKEMQNKRINGEIEDTLFLVEHEPIFTLGKNADENHLLPNRDQSVKVLNIDRGGDITFHGPGQLVGYPILDLSNYEKSVIWYIRTLEQVVIDTLFEFDIDARRFEGLTGVWVKDAKISALGVRIKRWVTMHGFSINVNTDLAYYNGIIPCGIFNYGVTSMKDQLYDLQDIEEVKKVLSNKFIQHFIQGK